jgi:hypothetical protein
MGEVGTRVDLSILNCHEFQLLYLSSSAYGMVEEGTRVDLSI